eukprot:CAMPEP_0197921694 /NCGR_PEP_ID=MMETSP1439-20131203/91060_1 /TAXON_ID=66791 /ORGANISM="Gonyaulax spinifera, Strain CCMP409" /LENGTH=54 /DNA_ID=CAMNT_0043543953 /DNA_START=71 /DNA_END=232 /DNA_ORIENTATION=-
MSDAEAMVDRQPHGWACGPGGCIDIKRWFIEVIKPDFHTTEARVRCGSVADTDM